MRMWIRRSYRRALLCALAVSLLGMAAGWGTAAAAYWPARSFGILAGMLITFPYHWWLYRPPRYRVPVNPGQDAARITVITRRPR